MTETYVIMPTKVDGAVFYHDVGLWIEHDLDSAIKRVVSLCEDCAARRNAAAIEHNAEVARLLDIGVTKEQLALLGIEIKPVVHAASLSDDYRIMQALASDGDGRFRVLLPAIEGLPCVSKWPWSTPVTSVYDIPLHWRPRSMKLED